MIEDVFIVTSQVERRAGGNLPTGASRSVQGINSERLSTRH